MDDCKIHITASFMDASTFFLFRENGVEVKFTIKNNMVFSERWLRDYERQYIKESILKKKDSFYKSLT
ncbi:hypothetical protein [Aquimarina sp. AU119]|uniref:hypothetical protein n=1 Tax=Aquimarina sp. AU119 TaxID=2108528 RepID=UPI000D6A02DC|nr:hypothetical protein [Aquimarina sp. AU119]